MHHLTHVTCLCFNGEQTLSHMKDVGAAKEGERLNVYRKKLAACHAWGADAAIARLEKALGVNIIVIGPTGTVINDAGKSGDDLNRPFVVLEHVPAGGGHYVLAGQCTDQGAVVVEWDKERRFERLPVRLCGTEALRTLFVFKELPQQLQARVSRLAGTTPLGNGKPVPPLPFKSN